jgi:hypothetical protein
MIEQAQARGLPPAATREALSVRALAAEVPALGVYVSHRLGKFPGRDAGHR